MFFSFWPHLNEFSRTRKDLTSDLIAGITVAIVALPLAIGFGITSGMSAAAGLTTAIIAGFLAALFGGSKFQVSGPTGAMTVILIPVIQKYGPEAIPARTSVNVRSHAKSRLASIFHALVLLLIALIAAPLVSYIPTAAIAGVLLGTSYRILNPSSIMESLRTTKPEAATLLVTAVSVLAIDLIWGMAIGIVLHLILGRIKVGSWKA